MAICGNCGEHTTRLTITMTANHGRTLLLEGERKEACPNCSPELFSDPFFEPSDRRIWPEHIARPHLYSTMPDGSLRARDSVLCEIQDAMEMDPDKEQMERQIAKKRASRRTTPLTQLEIEAAEREWRPIVKQREADQRNQEYEDRLYTEHLLEKHVRRSEAIH